jgi:holo-[acyl-carrier protein] synthase
MIIGIGCDVVQIPRIKLLVQESGERFLKRIFSDIEIELMIDGPNKDSYIAKRFAAKEAFAKAVGSGIGHRMHFNNIEILKTPDGQPFFSQKTLLLVGDGIQAFLSISDDYPIAIAQVVLSTHKYTFN